ncbi:hypothetical protein AB9X41_04315 [Ralstonia solanacearum]|uniref:hypothetical protein n=1 Tax=Ralstonia solanacearum TaxID=305 RepID=UPI0035128900
MSDSLDCSGREHFEAPSAAVRVLEDVEALRVQSKSFDAMVFGYELTRMLWHGEAPGSIGEEKQAERRHAFGWALQELGAWTPEFPHSLARLKIFLTTLLASSPTSQDAMEAVPQTIAAQSLLDGLLNLVQHVRFDADRWGDETQAAGRSGDYSMLANRMRHARTEFPPDFRLSVMLLARFAPDTLARCIEERCDVFFSAAVRNVLDADAARFALSVNDVTFKFICAFSLANMRPENAPGGSVDVVCGLMLQVAQTDSWRSWLLAFARYPHADTVAEKSLSMALAQLTATHWSAFVDAIELWTYVGTAGPVADILVAFLHQVGAEKSADMWRLAFERWDKWDYGSSGKDEHLLAPSVCSFDFPVSMHYALLPLEEVQAEEARLLDGIATIEQEWFTDVTELTTFRNRLSSRLRLVRHGLAIRNTPPEGVVDPLPPSIEPDSEFAKVRYRFYDVNAPRRQER